MKKISCLMLDMGGVLTMEQSESRVAEIIELLGSGFTRESFFSSYWRHRFDYDRGSIDSAAYWGLITAELGSRHSVSLLEDLVRLDLQSWYNMRQGMLDFLGGIQGAVRRLVLLSNVNVDGARYLRSPAGRPWSSRFDELVLSCEHGLLKPEIEIYELALDAAGALPGETLFVDDNPDNVEGALRAGMSSFRFTDETDFCLRLERDFELGN